MLVLFCFQFCSFINNFYLFFNSDAKLNCSINFVLHSGIHSMHITIYIYSIKMFINIQYLNK